MVNEIVRRNKTIEEMRKTYLEYYYSDEQLVLNMECMQALELNMYFQPSNIKHLLYNAFCKSQYNPEIIMHPQQMECLNCLYNGENLLISAPTSFGKTFIALEYICRKDFNNIVFVVPTLALMNELLLKIKRRFGDKYNLIQHGYEELSERNIFILVPERADIELLSKIPEIDLLVFDEIYKLHRKNNDKGDKRIISLNRGYFEIVNRSKQIILLGPFIKDISFERTKLCDDITKFISDYSPVYIKINYVDEKEDFVLDELINPNSKLVYFHNPNSIYEYVTKIVKEVELEEEENSLTQWCEKYISNSWLPSEMLKKGVGIHHGKLPGFMRRYIENLYNEGEIKNVLCTSTLLEGINTPTTELLVYDSEHLSAFELNNLIGRVGRLGQFEKGIVYLFDRSLDDKIIGDAKYEEVCIVAESNDVMELEEVIYLEKNQSELEGENLNKYFELERKLKRYNRTIEELKNTDGFIFKELLAVIDRMEEIIQAIKQMELAENEEITKARGNLISIFISIIKNRNKFMLININNSISKGKGIKEVVCINKLINLKPASIYQRIQGEIDRAEQFMDQYILNQYIDYLFDLAFSYIKYDLVRIVGYMDFLFGEKYQEENNEIKHLYKVLDENVLCRLRIYNNQTDVLLRVLIDLDIPYQDAKEISKIIGKSIERQKISTSTVLDKMNEMFDKIINSKRIEAVTKDLLKILLRK